MWLLRSFPTACIVSMLQGGWWTEHSVIPSPINDSGQMESFDCWQANLGYCGTFQGMGTLLEGNQNRLDDIFYANYQNPESFMTWK